MKTEREPFKPPFNPVEVTDLDLAFPAQVVGTLLPLWEDIPEEFQHHRGYWTKLVDTWFALGLDKHPATKDGIDPKTAWRHLAACMRSFQPKHEHKVAGVAYLMSLWLVEPKEGASA